MDIWPFNPEVVTKQMGPSEGFGEGQEAFDPMQVGYESNKGSDQGGRKRQTTAWTLFQPSARMIAAVGADQAGLRQPRARDRVEGLDRPEPLQRLYLRWKLRVKPLSMYTYTIIVDVPNSEESSVEKTSSMSR
jgi:hypothetical protein